MTGAAARLGQHDAITVERDEGCVEIQVALQLDCSRQAIRDRGDPSTGCSRCLGAVGRDRRRTTVLAVIRLRGRVDDHRNPRLAASRNHR